MHLCGLIYDVVWCMVAILAFTYMLLFLLTYLVIQVVRRPMAFSHPRNLGRLGRGYHSIHYRLNQPPTISR